MAQHETKEALFAAIAATTQDLLDNTAVNVLQRASSLQHLALAYRYVAGGTQPGSSVVEK
ncbi:MAG: hypothetical protein BGO97_03805 [Micrococcales bacterium 70-64]|nr:hypothetical protein [Leifsonia sp.]ODU63236.1 MAG: hypothetical protein ABT06_03810 [Leifsonia sp. SCN 70-46]OJX84927.1 MAG: hypothetical protein BGO97_03805 [Micrococcales bacterium 70-64]